MEIEYMNKTFIKPEHFNEKINELNESIDYLLNEFKKIFILSKMNSANQEYQQQFTSIVDGLNNIQSTLFTMSNDIQLNINNLNKYMITLNKNIENEKITNIKLKKKLGIVENKNIAASTMIDDYRYIYDELYLRNWALGLSIMIILYTIKNIFKK